MLGSVLGSVVWFPAARPAARKGFCGLWRKIKKTASACGIRVWGGGRARARTVDPLIKSCVGNPAQTHRPGRLVTVLRDGCRQFVVLVH